MNLAGPQTHLSRPKSGPLRETTVGVPQLSVIIVNYRQWTETSRLVRQLLGSPSLRRGRAEIIIVDNHSPYEPLVARLRHVAGVSLRRWGRNRGFARAANEGCRLSQGRWFLLLNPDVTLPAGFLEDVLRQAETLEAEKPAVGIVGFGLRNSDGTMQGSSGPFPSFLGTLAGLALPRTRRKYWRDNQTQAARVPWVTGCCLLVRRDCFRALGGFDEEFFLYYEDVDLCRRATAQGWCVWQEPALRVVHHHPLHQREVAPHMRLVTRHALLAYGAKHWPAWQVHLLARIVKAEAWCREKIAQRHGRPQDVRVFHQLGQLTSELAQGQNAAARKRLERIMRRQEVRSAR